MIGYDGDYERIKNAIRIDTVAVTPTRETQMEPQSRTLRLT